MKYLMQWSLPQATFRPAAERFLKTGAVPPAGVTIIGRWHGMNRQGCAVVEASDPKALFAYLSEWQEFIPVEATPLLEDADVAEALAPLFQ